MNRIAWQRFLPSIESSEFLLTEQRRYYNINSRR